MHVLFVCTGNTCRSPMAEAFMKKIAAEQNLNITCDSAGVSAFSGSPLSIQSKRVLEKAFGISDFNHEAKRVTPEMLSECDLAVAMTENHRHLLIQAFGAEDKAIAMPKDVGDPYGGDFDTYKKSADAILEGLNVLLEKGILHD